MKQKKSYHLTRTLIFVLAFVGGLAALVYSGASAASSTHQSTNAPSSKSSKENDLFYSSRSANQSAQSSSPAGKIAPEVLADTEDGKASSVVIFLADQADVSQAEKIMDQDARGWYVYNTLKEHADRTQTGLRDLLKSRGVEYQSFWVANMLVATADRKLIETLAARADVSRIDSNRSARWIEDPETARATAAPRATQAIEWGVANVNAPAVWGLGFNGAGIVIGDLDTGVRWTHAALKPHYRGWTGIAANHNYNWWDSVHSGGGVCGFNTVVPCDDSGHGTHTTGTTVGDDGAGNQIGVAPGAQWIGCRNMNVGSGTPASYTECFQFAIAPTDLTGNNPNPALRPHVVSNSWGCPVSEGCTTRAELETIVNNVQAAGIFVVVSAGNSGPGCSTVSDPPSIYNASFTVGAIDITNNLASFSSRGPSTFYTPNILKPQISAPGVNTRSSYRTSDTTYQSLNGTSMASPHVAGVVALLWSARPMLLRNIAATKSILQNTANPGVALTPQTCGGTPSTQIPNNSFGYGRIDALAAVNASPTAATGKISGTIVNANGQPVAGTTVTVEGEARTVRAITNRDGYYVVEGLETGGFYTITPERANYVFAPQQRSFSLIADRTDAVFTAAGIGADTANPLESPEFFVRQQYLDFLNREPEQSGLDFWSGQLRSCGSDGECLHQRRLDVSAAFFISQEFSESGLYLYDMYEGALGRRPQYAEYAADRRQVVGGPHLEADKAAFALSFVERGEFTTQYPLTMSGEVYVDALLRRAGETAGLDLTAERARLLALYQTGATVSESRSLVLRSVVEAEAFKQTQYNSGFVLSEYFSYLGRNPDTAGYQFWLNVLNSGDGQNYRGMVCSFVTSLEYQHRFATVAPRNNTECR
jgi:subtilisin family serine protease